MVCLFITGLALYFLVLVLGAFGTIWFCILLGVMIFKAIDYLYDKLSGRR